MKGTTMTINETERLIIRTFESQDIDAVMRFWGDPAVMRYCHGSIFDRDTIIKSIGKYKMLQDQRGHSVYAVVLKFSGEVIGGCGFNTTEKNGEVELIYHFSQDHWGKGYATEAANGCIEYIRKNPQFEKVSASIYPENRTSEIVLNKLGFKYTGMKWFEDSKCEEPCFELKMKVNALGENGISIKGSAARTITNS